LAEQAAELVSLKVDLTGCRQAGNLDNPHRHAIVG
jgi:hypothetical protein